MQSIIVKTNKKGWIKNLHPWVSADAFENYKDLKDKTIVQLIDEKGKFLAYGFFNKKSVVPIKIISYNKKDIINSDFFEKLIIQANKKRKKETIYRAFNGEADGIPGLFIDVLSDLIIYEINIAALNSFEKDIINIIKKIFNPKYIVKSGKSPLLILEKLEQFALEWIGKSMKNTMHIVKYNNVIHCFDLKEEINLAQKNNLIELSKIDSKKDILTIFCNNNGIIPVLKSTNPNSITSIDIKGYENVKIAYNQNNYKIGKDIFLQDDVYKLIENLIKKGNKYDLVIIDYPNYIKSYKEKTKSIKPIIYLLQKVINITKKEGIIVFSINSSFISKNEVFDIIKKASIKEQTRLQIFKEVPVSEDFPILSTMPESNIFNCLWMYKL